MADREELTPEEAARMLAQQPRCRACGVSVGRGIGRCRACEAEGREAAPVVVPTSRPERDDPAVATMRRQEAELEAALRGSPFTGSAPAYGFDNAMLACLGIGAVTAIIGASQRLDGILALWFGCALIALAVTGWTVRGAILSALRIHAAERVKAGGLE